MSIRGFMIFMESMGFMDSMGFMESMGFMGFMGFLWIPRFFPKGGPEKDALIVRKQLIRKFLNPMPARNSNAAAGLKRGAAGSNFGAV